MSEKFLDQSYREDLSTYLVEVSTKRPHFHGDLRTLVFECERRYAKGDVLAVHDALLACEQGFLPLPLWLSAALRRHFVESLTGGVTGTRGRGKSPVGEAKKRLRMEVHYRMVHTVLRLAQTLEIERVFASLVGERNQDHVFPRVILEKIQDPRFDVGLADFTSTLDGAYETASKLLRGTFAQAEARTIRRSFKTLERMRTSSDESLPEHIEWFSECQPETLEALGLQIELSDVEMYAWENGFEVLEPEAPLPNGAVENGFFIDVTNCAFPARKG
jgi:hypothetical protein